jgi:signal transduction histidine kinase
MFRIPLAFRLLLFFTFFGVFLNLLVWFHLSSRPFLPAPPPTKKGIVAQTLRPSMAFQIVTQADRSIARLKNSPNRNEELKVLEEDGYNIFYQKGDTSFATANQPMHPNEAWNQAIPFPPIPEYRTGRDQDGRNYIAWKFEDETWVFSYPQGYTVGIWSDPFFLRLLLGQTIVMVCLCFIFAFWQLRPLRALMTATDELSKGNFQHQIGVSQKSELGDLSQAFNSMTERIRSLVESKEEILIAISHEMRSPLARMRLAMIVEGEKCLPRIQRNIEMIDKLVSEILDVTRHRHIPLLSQQLTPLSVKELFEELKENYALQGPVVQFDLPDSMIKVKAHKDYLFRVLMNTIDNALKYADSEAGKIQVRAQRVADTIQFTVANRGSGIPETMLDKIFEPFFRVNRALDQKTGGYGLGLSLCRELIAAQGGKIWACNHPAGGLEIHFTLPTA